MNVIPRLILNCLIVCMPIYFSMRVESKTLAIRDIETSTPETMMSANLVDSLSISYSDSKYKAHITPHEAFIDSKDNARIYFDRDRPIYYLTQCFIQENPPFILKEQLAQDRKNYINKEMQISAYWDNQKKKIGVFSLEQRRGKQWQVTSPEFMDFNLLMRNYFELFDSININKNYLTQNQSWIFRCETFEVECSTGKETTIHPHSLDGIDSIRICRYPYEIFITQQKCEVASLNEGKLYIESDTLASLIREYISDKSEFIKKQVADDGQVLYSDGNEIFLFWYSNNNQKTSDIIKISKRDEIYIQTFTPKFYELYRRINACFNIYNFIYQNRDLIEECTPFQYKDDKTVIKSRLYEHSK